MKRISFKLFAGGLIAAIVIVVIAIGVLVFRLLDDDSSNRHVMPFWPTATTRMENEPVLVTQTPMSTKTIAVSSITMTPILPLLSTAAVPLLPNNHPSLGTGTPESCAACHQNVHGGGG